MVEDKRHGMVSDKDKQLNAQNVVENTEMILNKSTGKGVPVMRMEDGKSVTMNDTLEGNVGHADGGRLVKQFKKCLTVITELQGEGRVTITEFMRGIRLTCGGLLACRQTGARKYEVTMSSEKGKDKLLEGFKIGNVQILGRELCNDELVVSFLNLPAYVEDEEILDKLRGWGVSATSSIRRRMWPGTDVADGTRFCKVKFNQTVQSLPYSAKFTTASGTEYFRVIHDRQIRVCRLCIQPGHILRDCPEFMCRKCGVQGHYARECMLAAEKCNICHHKEDRCICANESLSSPSESGPPESHPLFNEESEVMSEKVDESDSDDDENDDDNVDDVDNDAPIIMGTEPHGVTVEADVIETGLGSSLDRISTHEPQSETGRATEGSRLVKQTVTSDCSAPEKNPAVIPGSTGVASNNDDEMDISVQHEQASFDSVENTSRSFNLGRSNSGSGSDADLETHLKYYRGKKQNKGIGKGLQRKKKIK